MEWLHPEDVKTQDHFDRILGRVALVSLVLSIAFMVFAWEVSATKLHQRRAQRDRLFNATQHESLPMPRWHRDLA